MIWFFSSIRVKVLDSISLFCLIRRSVKYNYDVPDSNSQYQSDVVITPLNLVFSNWLDWCLIATFANNGYNTICVVDKPFLATPFNSGFRSFTSSCFESIVRLLIIAYLKKSSPSNLKFVFTGKYFIGSKETPSLDTRAPSHATSIFSRITHGARLPTSSAHIRLRNDITHYLNSINQSLNYFRFRSPVVLFSTHGTMQWGALHDFISDKVRTPIRKYIWASNPYVPDLITFSPGPHCTSIPFIGTSIDKAISLASRLQGSTAPDIALTYPASNQIERDKILSRFSEFRANHDTVICIAPNCIWDDDTVDRDSFFYGIVDWVSATIQLVSDLSSRYSVGIVLRLHPAEASLWKNMPSLKESLSADLLAHASLFLIEGSARVSSAEISSLCTCLVCYSGISIYEARFISSVPVIVPSNSRDRLTPGCISPDTFDQYASLIESLCATHAAIAPDPASVEDIEAFHQRIHGSGFSVRDPYIYNGHSVPRPSFDLESILKYAFNQLDVPSKFSQ